MLAPCECMCVCAWAGDVLGTLRPKPLKARKCMAIRVAIVCAGQSLVEGVGSDRGGQAAWTSWLPKPGKLLDSNPRDCDCYCDCHCDCDCDCATSSVCVLFIWPHFVAATNGPLLFSSLRVIFQKAAFIVMQPYCYCIKIATPHTLVHDCRSLSLSLSVSGSFSLCCMQQLQMVRN